MLGMRFSLNLTPENPMDRWHTAFLPIRGPEPLAIAISCDDSTCRLIGAKIFTCPEDAVDREIMLDALGELTNITAGQVRQLLGLKQALGLPCIYGDENAFTFNKGQWLQWSLQSNSANLVLSISTDPSVLT